MDKIKLALFGIYYPLAMLSYFREALEHRDDIELWTCGPFTGNWIPWGESGGMDLPMRHVKPVDMPLPRESIRYKVDPKIIEGQLPWTPDLSLIIDAGWHFSSRPSGKIVAHVQTDPHVLKPTYSLPKSYSDFSFCMQLEYATGDEIYLPYAYSKYQHYPMDIEKEYDVCMIGLHYEPRTQLVNKLLQKGVSVHYSIGEIFDEYREAYNKSRIGINWSSLKDLNARAFELPAMGICAVQNTVPDMKNFFVPNDHYLEFSTVDEAVAQVLFALNNESERDRIAGNAMRKVQPHTYDVRVADILDRVGLRSAD